MRPPVQPRSLTPAEQRVRATRPDLWPVFQAPPAPPMPPEHAGDDLGGVLALLDEQ